MTIETSIEAAFRAIERGAALVYHDVLATGAVITTWEAGNPEIAPMVRIGLDYATSALARFGVPVGAVEVVGVDILAALKLMAAQDATVPSVPTVTTTTTAAHVIPQDVIEAANP